MRVDICVVSRVEDPLPTKELPGLSVRSAADEKACPGTCQLPYPFFSLALSECYRLCKRERVLRTKIIPEASRECTELVLSCEESRSKREWVKTEDMREDRVIPLISG